MASVCKECGLPLTRPEQEAGFSLCYYCRVDFDENPRLADPYAKEERGIPRRCPTCGTKMRFGTCWLCRAKDSGKPCDPKLLALSKKWKRK